MIPVNMLFGNYKVVYARDLLNIDLDHTKSLIHPVEQTQHTESY